MNQDRVKSWQMVMFMVLLAGGTVLGSFSAAPPVEAASEGPVLDASLTMKSHYVWRGFELSNSNLLLQPSVTLAWQEWSANVWANYDTDAPEGIDAWNETDITLSYVHSLESATLALSYIYYAIDEVADSQELSVGVSLDSPANPSLIVYREIDHYPGWYIVAGVAHSIPLTEEIALDLAATAGILWSDSADVYAEPDSDDPFRGFFNGHLQAAIAIPLADNWTITPELNYSFPLSDKASDLIESQSMNGDDDRFFYVGATIGVSF